MCDALGHAIHWMNMHLDMWALGHARHQMNRHDYVRHQTNRYLEV